MPKRTGMEPRREHDFEAAPVTTAEEREAIFALRMQVFVEEQGVPPEEELDLYDMTATHLLARRFDVPSEIVGTARLIDKGAGQAVVGRVAVHRDYRGLGVGALLMRYAETVALAQGFARLDLGAQCYAIPFYEKLGYTAEGDIYLDCAIEHRHMYKILRADGMPRE